MIDIDDRLHSLSNVNPRRQISAGFTDRAMMRVMAIGKQTPMQRAASLLKRSIPMKLRHIKHAGVVASSLAVMLLGGTTYAALHWQGRPGVSNYGGVTKLANGDTRFWVHVHDCSDEQGKQWFDIKAGAPITAAQISDMAAGTCEMLDPTALFPGITLYGTLPKGISYPQPDAYPKAMASTEVNTQYYMGGGIIQRINSESLTVSTPGQPERTIPILPTAKAFKDGRPLPLSDIKPGQPTALVLEAQATFAQAQRQSFIPGSVVYGIELTHHEPYDMTLEGKEFTRLVPNPNIKNHPTGKDNPAVMQFYQDPKNLIEEHPLH